jgi:hypothetical protein
MLPNLVTIGAMKCATTSLHHYLGLHPEISMARQRGLNFFLEGNHWRGPDWYAAQFRGSEKIHGDTSPRYTNFPLNPGVPERMFRTLPHAKLLYIVRDPVERIVSHYTHYVAAGYEDRPIATALEGMEDDPVSNPYVCRSLYHLQLEQYLGRYSRSQIHVLFYEDLRDRRAKTLADVFRFLGVDDRIEDQRFARVHHRTSEKRRLTPAGRKLDAWLTAPLAHFSQDARVRIASTLTRPFSRRVQRPELTAELERRLRNVLRPDVQKLLELVPSPGPWSA